MGLDFGAEGEARKAERALWRPWGALRSTQSPRMNCGRKAHGDALGDMPSALRKLEAARETRNLAEGKALRITKGGGCEDPGEREALSCSTSTQSLRMNYWREAGASWGHWRLYKSLGGGRP